MERYLYGVINGRFQTTWEGAGIAGQDIFTIPHESVSMVASRLEPTDLNSLPKKRVLQYLAVHQAVCEKFLSDHDILPVKFGTLVRDDREIRYILASAHDMIRGTLERFKGTVELDLVARFSDLGGLLKKIGASEAVKARVQELNQARSPDARVAVGMFVKAQLDTEKLNAANTILDGLAGICQDHRIHGVEEEDLVFSGAFLVQKTGMPLFEEALMALDGKLEDQVNFRLIGPMPYAGFRTLAVDRAGFEAMDAARKRLDLPKIFTRRDIRASYQKLCRTLHPDVNPDPESENQFSEVEKAFQLLMDFGPDEAYIFEGKKGNDFLKIGVMKGDEPVCADCF